jgi:hypothetical protein
MAWGAVIVHAVTVGRWLGRHEAAVRWARAAWAVATGSVAGQGLIRSLGSAANLVGTLADPPARQAARTRPSLRAAGRVPCDPPCRVADRAVQIGNDWGSDPWR